MSKRLRRIFGVALAATVVSAGLAAAAPASIEPRAIDGSGNNIANPTWGSAGNVFFRLNYGAGNPLGNAYGDGTQSPARADGPNTRTVSTTLSRQTAVVAEPQGFNEMLAWWLFQVHIDIAAGAQGGINDPIAVPAGDDPFDLAGTGTEQIAFRRSLSTFDFFIPTPAREIINLPTAFLDVDPIYRNTAADHAAVRTGAGGQLVLQPTASGELVMPSVAFIRATDPGFFPEVPPFLSTAVPTTGGSFAPGAALATLIIREHNRVAAALDAQPRGVRQRIGLPGDAEADPAANDEAVFQLARRIVEAEVQAITYGEVLPALGIDLGPYGGYDASAFPGVNLEFATGPMRVHTMLNQFVQPVDASGAASAPIDLAGLFTPGSTYSEWVQGGVDGVIRGMLVTPAQQHDLLLDEGLRSIDPERTLGPAGDLNDLMATHINRGRDRGVPDYGEVRRALGLAPVVTFADVTSDVSTQADLASLYSTPTAIDPIVGILAEDRVPGSLFGETAKALYELQFEITRSTDRLWHQVALQDDPGFRLALRRVGLDTRNNQGTWELDRTLAGLIGDTTSVGEPGDIVSLDSTGALMAQ